MHTVSADLTNTLFPSDCRLCSAPMVAFVKVRICDGCLSRVGSRTGGEIDIQCTRCGEALGLESSRFTLSLGLTECTTCRLAPPGFARAVAFCTYDNEMRELLTLLKFEGQRKIAEHILGHRVGDAILQLRPHAAAELVVIPVPLFAAHERRRGYNQAMLLAQSAVQHLRRTEPAWKFRLAPRVLSRIRDTAALYRLDPSQRRSNLRGAFRVLDASAIEGREVLLIDDIMTTGTTARECSGVLLAAGAAKVWVATAARAQDRSNVARSLTPPEPGVARWDAPPLHKPAVIEPRVIEPDIDRRKIF